MAQSQRKAECGKLNAAPRCVLRVGALLACAISLSAFGWMPAAHAAGPPVQRRSLANGATLQVSEQHALPMVVINIVVDAGARRDPRGKEGLAALTADLLSEGTKTRSAAQISEAADFIGAHLSTGADTDYASLSVTAVSKDLDTALTLLGDVLLHPTFPEAEVLRRREAALAALRESEDDPGLVAQRTMTQTLFRHEPYGHLASGTPETVRTLTRADVVGFYQRFYHPDGAIVTVVGDVSLADIEARMQAALGEWNGAAPPAFEYGPVAPANGSVVLVDKPVSQANIILAQRGVARDNPDYYALTVMNFILGGGGFTSRLLDNIRTKGGLAYSVGSGFSVNKFPGSFEIVMQTKNQSANDAMQRACGEVERIRRELVSDDELTGAKLYLTGSFPMRFDTNSKVAGFLSQVLFYNLGDDYADTYAARINAVTKEEILRVAQQYLQPEQFDLVVVGGLDKAGVPDAAPCRAAHAE
jgi:zinc protease